MSVCVSACLCVSVYTLTQKIMVQSIQSKLEHFVVYENSSDDFEQWALSDQGQGHIHLPQYKLSSPISQLWHTLGSCD